MTVSTSSAHSTVSEMCQRRCWRLASSRKGGVYTLHIIRAADGLVLFTDSGPWAFPVLERARVWVLENHPRRPGVPRGNRNASKARRAARIAAELRGEA